MKKSMHNETITLSLPLFGTSSFQKRKDSCFILFLTPICNNLFLNYFTNNWKNPVFYKVIQITPVCQVFKRFFVDILSTKSKTKNKKTTRWLLIQREDDMWKVRPEYLCITYVLLIFNLLAIFFIIIIFFYFY